MRPIESLSHGEALWERIETVNEENLAARRRLCSLSPSQQEAELALLSPAARRFVVLSIAVTRATGLLALAFGGHTDEEIKAYAQSIPEPAGGLARQWARDDWEYWRRQPASGSS